MLARVAGGETAVEIELELTEEAVQAKDVELVVNEITVEMAVTEVQEVRLPRGAILARVAGETAVEGEGEVSDE
ncbi:hypothetical protein ON010_g3972 [Phytophthora cinnamomi]|nr:hypothetical protein ON010_g3972 [Phytophthora cinnamomi]